MSFSVVVAIGSYCLVVELRTRPVEASLAAAPGRAGSAAEAPGSVVAASGSAVAAPGSGAQVQQWWHPGIVAP